MDEALEGVGVVAASELESAFAWLLGLPGLLAAIVGPWLFTEAGLLVLPVLLVVAGLVLLVVPNALLTLAELTG